VTTAWVLKIELQLFYCSRTVRLNYTAVTMRLSWCCWHCGIGSFGACRQQCSL